MNEAESSVLTKGVFTSLFTAIQRHCYHTGSNRAVVYVESVYKVTGKELKLRKGQTIILPSPVEPEWVG